MSSKMLILGRDFVVRPMLSEESAATNAVSVARYSVTGQDGHSGIIAQVLRWLRGCQRP